MSLRLVRDEPPKPKRRKHARTRLLSDIEERRFRAAMRGLQGAFGSWACLADAMEINANALHHLMSGYRAVSGEMIVRAMKASGLTLAELLGAPVAADRCRACGAVKRAS